MTSARPLAQLRNAFGSLSQNPPAPSARDSDASPMVDQALAPEVLPVSPKLHEKSDIVLLPSCRIDGSATDGPWTIAEPTLWNWLRTTPIEHVEERVLDGLGGSFWVRCRNDEGELRSALLRFDTVGYDKVYEVWGEEYGLSLENHDVLRREQAAYEVAKGLGCEDLAPPIAAREANLVPLISDAVRDLVAAELGIDQILVDETFGVIAALQAVPLNARNFVEYWATLGPDAANRLARASDGLRHGIYRMVALDFVLGTGDRSLADFLFNEASGSLVAYGFGVTFPNPIATADRYLAQRAQGWGRRLAGPLEEPTPGAPPYGSDSTCLPRKFVDREREECLATFKQMSKAADEATIGLLCRIMVEIGVPQESLAGFVARLVFLQEDPESVIDNQFDFVRSILVPMRRGYGFDVGRNAKIVDTVNQLLGAATGAEFDFASLMQSQPG
jgi:hypothetical protein